MDWANDPSLERDFFVFDLDGGSGGNNDGSGIADLVLIPPSTFTSAFTSSSVDDDDEAVDDVDDVDTGVPFRVDILR